MTIASKFYVWFTQDNLCPRLVISISHATTFVTCKLALVRMLDHSHVVIPSAQTVQADHGNHGNHHVTPKQEKMTTSVKVIF